MGYQSVLENIEEIVTEEEVEQILQQESPVSYWGVAPTGSPHLGYYRVLEKQLHLLEAGFDHKVLIADLHAYLDDEKCPWDEMSDRAEVYEICFRLLGLDDATFVRGSDYQLSEDYVIDLYRAFGKVTGSRAEHAASEVVRGDSPSLGSLAYPVMQSLDCAHLNVDLALGGIDQRHVYMLTRELLPEIGYNKVSFLFTPLGKSPSGSKMSASEDRTKIELWAEPEDIHEKIEGAYCPEQNVEDNPVVDYVSHFVFPQNGGLMIERPEKYGGDLEYDDRVKFQNDYAEGVIHPADLKPAAADAIAEALKPVRDYFDSHPDMLETFDRE